MLNDKDNSKKTCVVSNLLTRVQRKCKFWLFDRRIGCEKSSPKCNLQYNIGFIEIV